MVLIAVLAVLCIFALIGMKKGVIKIAVSLATMVITIAVTAFDEMKTTKFWKEYLHI